MSTWTEADKARYLEAQRFLTDLLGQRLSSNVYAVVHGQMAEHEASRQSELMGIVGGAMAFAVQRVTEDVENNNG